MQEGLSSPLIIYCIPPLFKDPKRGSEGEKKPKKTLEQVWGRAAHWNRRVLDSCPGPRLKQKGTS